MFFSMGVKSLPGKNIFEGNSNWGASKENPAARKALETTPVNPCRVIVKVGIPFCSILERARPTAAEQPPQAALPTIAPWHPFSFINLVRVVGECPIVVGNSVNGIIFRSGNFFCNEQRSNIEEEKPMNTLLGLIVLILDVIAIVDLLKGNATTGKKLLWILLIVLLPLVGMILYFVMNKKKAAA